VTIIDSCLLSWATVGHWLQLYRKTWLHRSWSGSRTGRVL